LWQYGFQIILGDDMDLDDLPKPDTPIAQLLSEDLASHSVNELRERISMLAGEIARIEVLIESKEDSKSAADAFFKS
jgi:uncharacterized small protein (DUF1192 family)